MPRLRETKVTAVALVKNPANRRPFIVRKTADKDNLMPTKSANAGQPSLNLPPEDVRQAIEACVAKSAGTDDARQALDAIATLMHNVPGLTVAGLVDLGKAAGLEEDAVFKAKKDLPNFIKDKMDEDDDEDEDDEDDYDDEDEDEDDEDKKKVAKGGPGSGPQPGGGEKSSSSISRDAKASGASRAARAASEKANNSGSAKDHAAAEKAHFKAFQAQSRAGDKDKAASHMRMAASHGESAKSGVEKSQETADLSANQGGPMEAEISKSEMVSILKAHKQLQADYARMSEELEVEKNHRLTKSIKEELTGQFKHLTLDMDNLTNVVKTMRAKEDRTDHDNFMQVLKSADSQVGASRKSGNDITRQLSKSSYSTGSSSTDELETMVSAHIAKSGRPMTRGEAIKQLMPTPEFRALDAQFAHERN